MSARPKKEIDLTTYTGRFADRLRTLRTKANLTVDELAKKSGISRTTLFSWEATDRSPTIDRFPELANALGVKVRNLFPEK